MAYYQDLSKSLLTSPLSKASDVPSLYDPGPTLFVRVPQELGKMPCRLVLSGTCIPY